MPRLLKSQMTADQLKMFHARQYKQGIALTRKPKNKAAAKKLVYQRHVAVSRPATGYKLVKRKAPARKTAVRKTVKRKPVARKTVARKTVKRKATPAQLAALAKARAARAAKRGASSVAVVAAVPIPRSEAPYGYFKNGKPRKGPPRKRKTTTAAAPETGAFTPAGEFIGFA